MQGAIAPNDLDRDVAVRPTPAGFPYVALRTTAELNGVALREHGVGSPFVFVPGMTGAGQASLHLAVRAIARARTRGDARRLVLVDYTHETHPTLEALQETVIELVRRAVGRESCVLWTESLGNLVAPPGPLDRAVLVAKRVMVSPFTAIPSVRLALGLAAMALSPAFLYRLAIRPFGRLFFGPAGDCPDHVFFAGLAATSAATARRRSAWLWRRTFGAWFERSSVPTRAWIGVLDRLVCGRRERASFERLAKERPDFGLALVEGGGHVVTDSRLTERLFGEIDAWIAS